MKQNKEKASVNATETSETKLEVIAISLISGLSFLFHVNEK